jgi:hypothetical protein
MLDYGWSDNKTLLRTKSHANRFQK